MDRMTVVLRLGSEILAHVNIHPALFAHAVQTQSIGFQGTRYIVGDHALDINSRGDAVGSLRLRVRS